MPAFSPARLIAIAVGALIAFGAAGCSDDDDSGPQRSRSAEEARKCLADDGFRATGGKIDTSDRDDPDGVVYAYSNEAHAQIAFYDDLARAVKHEPDIRKNARRFEGEVHRIDRATIVWLRKPALGARMRVERCVTAP